MLNKKLLSPLSLLSWLAMAIIWLLIRGLPRRLLLRLGHGLGHVMYYCAPTMRRTTQVNIHLCFPELSPEQQQRFIKKCFVNAGMALFETGYGWFAPGRTLKKIVTITGLEHVHAALSAGQGVLLVGAHQSTLQLAGRLLGTALNFGVVYRKQHNPVFNYVVERMLAKHYKFAIPRENIFKLQRMLRNQEIVWYSPDIDPRDKASVFAPFFGINAATVKIPSKFAQKTPCAIIPISYYRDDHDDSYQVTCLPALSDFPSADLMQDTARINAVLEAIIRKQPEQYLWQYKRFKTRPDGQPNPYKLSLPIPPGVIS